MEIEVNCIHAHMQFSYKTIPMQSQKNLKIGVWLPLMMRNNHVECAPNGDHIVLTNKTLYGFTNKSTEKRAHVKFWQRHSSINLIEKIFSDFSSFRYIRHDYPWGAVRRDKFHNFAILLGAMCNVENMPEIIQDHTSFVFRTCRKEFGIFRAK